MIHLGDNFHDLVIPRIEKYYGTTYVGDFPLELPDESFRADPVSVFWRPENLRTAAFPEYYGIIGVKKLKSGSEQYFTYDCSYITGYIFNGLKLGDDIVYSRYANDKRIIKEGVWIAGGFDACEWEGADQGAELVRLQVQGPAIVVL